MDVYRVPEEDSFSIKMTPLVDIVLLVLIFFLVTTTYSQIHQQVDVDLPETGVADAAVESQIQLFITRTGRYRLEGEEVSPGEISTALADVARETPREPVLLISADRGVEYETLINLVEEARGAGIANIGFGVSARRGR